MDERTEVHCHSLSCSSQLKILYLLHDCNCFSTFIITDYLLLPQDPLCSTRTLLHVQHPVKHSVQSCLWLLASDAGVTWYFCMCTPFFCIILKAKLIYERTTSCRALHLGGDGKYDSPGKFYQIKFFKSENYLFNFNIGFSARYLHYVVMDLDSDHVLSFFTAIKHQVFLIKS